MANATEATTGDGTDVRRRPHVDRLVFVSDLHLSPSGFGRSTRGPGDLEPTEAFVGFTEHLCRDMQGEHSRSRLVLLGDTLELLDPRLVRAHMAAPNVAARLEAIADANPSVLESLGRAVAAGWELTVVPGNHDTELVFLDVQRLFTEAVLGHPSFPKAITFDPWIFLVPGVVYAEHGHQYHDLNAFASVLVPSLYDEPDRLEHPIGAYVDSALRDVGINEESASNRSFSVRARTWGAVARAGIAYARATVSSRDARDAHRVVRMAALRRYAEQSHLSHQSVTAIDALSRRGAGALAARATRYGIAKVAKRLRLGRERLARTSGYSPAYLHEGARAIDSILGLSGEGTPFYVFGHSHVAERVPLGPDDLGPPWVLGTGTWTTEGPRGADLPSRRARYPWVEVTRQGEEVSAHVRIWDARTGLVEVHA